MNEDVLILYSGGSDSTLLLEFAKSMGKKIYALLIDYGQGHKKELKVASEILVKERIQFQTVKIQDLMIDSGLTGALVGNKYENVSEWHVPGRNLMFVSIAASIAEARNIPVIWYGADYSDKENLFPDCYQDWVYEVNKTLQINGSKQIRLEAPLLGMTKEMVLDLLADLYKIQPTDIFSGYGDLQE